VQSATNFGEKWSRPLSGLELLHLLGQDPERPVEADRAVDAADGPGPDAPALRAAARLSAPLHVLLQAVHGEPEAVADVLGPARLADLVDGDRHRRLSLAALAVAECQGRGGERAFLLGLQRDRLHGIDRPVDRREVIEHPEGAFDDIVLGVALVRDADVVCDITDDEAVAADESQYPGEHLVRAGAVVTIDQDDLVGFRPGADMPGMAHADHVFGELAPAFDASPSLRDHEGLEAF